MYVEHTLEFLRAIRRVLRDDGTVFYNLGDSYAGSGVHANHHANPGISRAGQRGGAVATGTSVGPQRYRLRGDLSEEERVYVLTELAKTHSTSEATQEGLE